MTSKDLTEIRRHLENQLSYLNEQPLEMGATGCADPNEFASQVADTHLKAAISARTSASIREIQEALRRMQVDSYGICQGCGEEIGLARLKARPTATTCLDCQDALERAQ